MVYRYIDWDTLFEAAALLGISPVILAGMMVVALAANPPAPLSDLRLVA